MMQLFAQINNFGVPEIVRTTWHDNMIEVPEGVDPITSMYAGGQWTLRPAVDVKGVDGKVILTNVPKQTCLEITDLEIGAIIFNELIDGDETLSFDDRGHYQISVVPPAPWLGWEGRLQC